MRPSPPLYSALPATIRAVLARHRGGVGISASSQTPSSPGGNNASTSTNTSLQQLKDFSDPSSSSSGSLKTDVQGWVKSLRVHKNVSFATISDGTTIEPLQAVLKGSLPDNLTVGSSVKLSGRLGNSKGRGQDLEFAVDNCEVIGECDPAVYPIQKKELPDSVLRDNAHLRFRTTQMAAVMSLRDGVMRDWHDWFEENEFTYVHTPVLTSSDCEGAGETFGLINCASEPQAGPSKPLSSSSSQPSTSMISGSSVQLQDVSSSSSAKESAFFPHLVNLTVSSQLHLEAPTHALSRTYTLSPCFRAEGSMTSRHLAEFYMLEAEIAWITTLDQLLDAVENSMKSTLQAMLNGGSTRSNRMRQNLATLDKSRESSTSSHVESRSTTRIDELQRISKSNFARITYTEAVKQLEDQHKRQAFSHEPTRGEGLSSEHEKWLASQYDGPVFVTHYPASLKPFYMLPSHTAPDSTPGPDGIGDKATVACFDLLLPGLGEIAGGSLREHRLSHLLTSIRKHGLSEEDYGWYLDLRRYGSVPHGGWGMGWDRWISWVSGVPNVRDVVAFPRWAGHCKY